ncbi:MAG: hypothetical protein SWH54_01315 [Thermodesulfobacteriota bacterium]|nr:hypothetical protein [Thermodesulfobacteriota bacterium]
MKNPWLRKAPDIYPVDFIQSASVEDRISELSNFDEAKLRAVIAYPGTQKTVRRKAECRLKTILKNDTVF